MYPQIHVQSSRCQYATDLSNNRPGNRASCHRPSLCDDHGALRLGQGYVGTQRAARYGVGVEELVLLHVRIISSELVGVVARTVVASLCCVCDDRSKVCTHSTCTAVR